MKLNDLHCFLNILRNTRPIQLKLQNNWNILRGAGGLVGNTGYLQEDIQMVGRNKGGDNCRLLNKECCAEEQQQQQQQ